MAIKFSIYQETYNLSSWHQRVFSIDYLYLFSLPNFQKTFNNNNNK